MTEAQALVPLSKAMRVVNLLRRDRAQWRKAFHGGQKAYDSWVDDYENTLKELRVILDNEDLAAAFELIDEKLEDFS